MKVLITNAHSKDNKGDAAIVLAMINEIRRRFGDPRITIVSDTAERDRDYYTGCEVISIFFPWGASRVRLLWYYVSIILHALCRRMHVPGTECLVDSSVVEFLDRVTCSDVVVSCGGGYLSSRGRLTFRLYTVWCGELFKKRTVFYSQSVDLLESWFDRWKTRYVVNRSDIFIAREECTKGYLREIGVNAEKVVVCADAVFCFASVKEELALTVANGGKATAPKLGLTVTRWSMPSERGNDTMERYCKAIRETAEYAVKELGWKLYVLPQVVGPSKYSDDRILAREIFAGEFEGLVTLIEDDLHPIELMGMIGKMDFFLGTRMHSNIFSLCNGIPTIAISYQNKTLGIMRMLRLDEFVVGIGDVDSAKLQALVSKMSESAGRIRRDLRTSLELAKASAQKAVEFV